MQRANLCKVEEIRLRNVTFTQNNDRLEQEQTVDVSLAHYMPSIDMCLLEVASPRVISPR